MKSPFDKAIKSFRKQIKKLSKEEIEERLNKYKIMEDLTDKINLERLFIDKYKLYPSFSYIDGAKDCLKEITPKVAIDFAKWTDSNAVTNGEDSWLYRLNNWNSITSKQLFQEFLKDYKYE